MSAGADEDEQPGQEEYEHFMEIRRHVKRMQAGTPILLRTIESSGQEELQICTFWVAPDFQFLKWKDQEGSNVVREVPISAIMDIAEDRGTDPRSPAAAAEDGHHALTLVLNSAHGSRSKDQIPSTMGLICASPEDLTSWRDGLKFLVGAMAPSLHRMPEAGALAAAASASSAGSHAPEAELRSKLQQQAEEMDKLRQENEMLREMVRRKDVTIEQLLRDLEGRALMDRCGKTESTSRESDQHLRDREVAILQRKNQRLQKALRAKQQTVSDLLQLLGRVTQQQGAESSAVEDVGNDDDGEDSDTPPVVAGRVGALHAPGPSAAAARRPAPAPPARGATATAAAKPHGSLLGRRPAEEAPEASEPPASSVLRSAPHPSVSPSGSMFRPPPRAPGGSAPAEAPVVPSPKAAGASMAATAATAPSPSLAAASASPLAAPKAPAATPPQSPQRLATTGERLFKVVAAGTGPTTAATAVPVVSGQRPLGSEAALQALARELALLEEKKRVVEQLARRLEPPSDGEEDDGFPLR